jgi:hypothetical protein
VDGEIKKETPVFIKTKGWKGIIERKPVPVYLNEKDIKGKGSMGVSSPVLQAKTGSPVFNDTWVDFTNVREFDSVDAGNFTFDAVLRNISTVEESLCRKIYVSILGTKSAIIVPLCDKGCISDIDLLKGYVWVSGKDNDLSAFGCEMKNFQQVTCTVESRRLKIYLNGKAIFDTDQPVPIGDIIGIRFAVEGAGEIKTVKLASHGRVAYEERF